ncbi:uncharacterized protein EI90DRAFT_3067300 [Cantharellus anzutake]|uniref:uncharacterized protein n=1 Tax=Cantharellus anzutake TaxID=1750568 RepID=UPI001904B73D|nr:uncharacterized protein EI90DRAFT_3067300 [Cantharellus anzutake]KAF8327580.1 hypothetical protein EI90DRAFT_3067300 [Cantharellus anzutake]
MSVPHHHHRPTLKQQNKSFKSRHKTKGQLKALSKGRAVRQSAKASQNPQSAAAQLRADRRIQSKHLQAKKRAEIVEAGRVFSGPDAAPRVVAIIPLCEDVNAVGVLTALLSPLDLGEEILGEIPQTGLWKVKIPRFKTSLQTLLLPYHSFYAALDATKAADYVIFVLSTQVEVDDWGDTLLRSLQAQGLPTIVTVAADSSSTTPSSSFKKDRSLVIKSLLSFIQYFFPSQHRVHDLGPACVPSENSLLSSLNQNECLNALRSLCEGLPANARWRDGRMWLVADANEGYGSSIPSLSWEPNLQETGAAEHDDGEPRGTLSVIGTIRGAPLSANRLIHIPNYGDFQIDKVVDASASTQRGKKATTNSQEPEVSSELTILAQRSSKSGMDEDEDVDDADSLVSRMEPDTMQNEQTWPTEEEMNGGVAAQTEDSVRKGVKKVRVPKGTSSYQAAWIVHEDDENDVEEWESEDENSKDGNEDEVMEDEPTEAPQFNEEEEMEDIALDEGKRGAFEDLDAAEEERQLESWRKAQAESRARQKEDETDLEFPDEINTPKDIPARQRFARYRGLRSFRTSPWDPFENLPLDYARIFMLEDYKRIEKSVRRKAAEEGVAPGTRVIVYIKNVPRSLYTSQSSPSSALPLIIFGLFKYEHKYSVGHFSIQRNTEYTGSVRSKDPLVLCVGARRYRVNPIYSEHRTGKGNGLYKFERYLRHSHATVASIFGPIGFGKQSCTLLREDADPQAPKLVATGSFINADPKRIIAKRIILTGHPYKVHKKTATIRYMFFYPEDVKYFSPVQLYTKYGRTGHITESLGTHGYFKAHFDQPIFQMDTICLNLYKRVFPKWSEPWVDPTVRPKQLKETTSMDVEM